jgi:hypothetical protein
MTESVPTGKTYFWFAALWIPTLCVVALFCSVLFASDHPIAAAVVMVLTGFLFFRHSFAIGRRMRMGIRRLYGRSN